MPLTNPKYQGVPFQATPWAPFCSSVADDDDENGWRRGRRPLVLLAGAHTTITGRLRGSPAVVSVRAPFLSILNYFIDVSTVCHVRLTATDRLKLVKRGRGLRVEGDAGRGRGGRSRTRYCDDVRTIRWMSRRLSSGTSGTTMNRTGRWSSDKWGMTIAAGYELCCFTAESW